MKFIYLITLLPVIALSNPNSITVGKIVKPYSEELEVPRITMDLNVLKNTQNFDKKRAITIEISKDSSLTFIPKRLDFGKKDGDFTWVGQSKKGKAKAIFTIKNNIMMGTVTLNNEKYKIYPEGKYFKVIKIDSSMAIPFYNDAIDEKVQKELPLPDLDEDELSEISHTMKKNSANEEDNKVTILVYYTQSLKDKYGANTETMIQANLDLAKDAYIDSNTEIELEVAAIKQVPANSDLAKADPDDLSDLLSSLRTDGFARYERELYKADAVTVFSKFPDGNYCGLGYTPQDTSNTLIGAFTAVHIKPGSEGGRYCSDLSFAHELGHNFGCFHDSDHVSSGSAMYDYAYGYDVTGEFGTIMSYDGPEISFFSNPNITDSGSGLSIGDAATANNARAIRENKLKMSDNSEQISEALESGDSQNNYLINGELDKLVDRDAYIVWFEGDTRFIVDNNKYSNNPFFLNIYNESTHKLLESFNDDDKTFVFPKGRYRVTLSFINDGTGSYYNLDNIGYTVNIDTEYEAPVFNSAMPSIISYMLN